MERTVDIREVIQLTQEEQQKLLNRQGYQYTRQQCNRMFRVPVEKNQQMFNVKECQVQIDKALGNMKQFGYLIQRLIGFNTVFKRIRNTKQRTMSRKVRLQFHCRKRQCSKTFTTIVGTCQVKFTYRRVSYAYVYKKQTNTQIQKHDNSIVQYKVNLYRMLCKSCQIYCQPLIYKSQLTAVISCFCFIISQMMDLVEPPDPEMNRHKDLDVHNHEEELCQACKLGTCHNIKNELWKLFPFQQFRPKIQELGCRLNGFERQTLDKSYKYMMRLVDKKVSTIEEYIIEHYPCKKPLNQAELTEEEQQIIKQGNEKNNSRLMNFQQLAKQVKEKNRRRPRKYQRSASYSSEDESDY